MWTFRDIKVVPKILSLCRSLSAPTVLLNRFEGGCASVNAGCLFFPFLSFFCTLLLESTSVPSLFNILLSCYWVFYRSINRYAWDQAIRYATKPFGNYFWKYKTQFVWLNIFQNNNFFYFHLREASTPPKNVLDTLASWMETKTNLMIFLILNNFVILSLYLNVVTISKDFSLIF